MQDINTNFKVMAKYGEEQLKEHMEQIRELLIKNPRITVLGAREALANNEHNPLSLDKDYINKLLRWVRTERFCEKNRYLREKVVSDLEGEYLIIKQRLWKIIDKPNSSDMAKIAALREVKNCSLSLVDRMITANVFSNGEENTLQHILTEEEQLLSITPEQIEQVYLERKIKIEHLKEKLADFRTYLEGCEGMDAPDEHNS